ncbi:MAG: D-alanyl-D-alanine carboxypeptidase family protein [Sinobacteraceae bacterium]|nr:D-alanyl-D-alanine carboxypeptidase family protein [Nevskia sp.]MDI3260785.1 D-alanyl-D-alanine carboxypeptidase family protein [Nevskiaceae bacterium]
MSRSYSARVRAALRTLGAPANLVETRGLPLHVEARSLRCVGLGSDGRDKFLAPAAARAWLALRAAAQAEDVELLLVSAFRSFDFQFALIRRKLQQGRSLEEVLGVNAPPGCSEHHSGRAVDIGTRDCEPLAEDFENTPAFAWLQGNAARFGFALSYPRGNRYGFLYEPWHWCWQPGEKIP